MQHENFRWDDALVLSALLREGTLSGAAARLGVNTSTIGRRLDALEAVLGGRLFDRSRDGVSPTALAERLGPHAEGLERSAASFVMAAAGREMLPEGEVRVTAPPGVAEHVVAPALPRLLARWPRLRITLDASVANADLSRREADLALRVVPPASGDLVTKKLAEVPEVLLASRAYSERIGVLRRLDQAQFITWADDLAHIPAAQWVARAVKPEAIVLRTSSIGAQLAAVQEGLGVAVLARMFAKPRGLVEVRLAPSLQRKVAPWPQSALWLVGHRALRDVPRVAAVWAFLEKEAKRYLGGLAP
jgi:DNA-binding transcriptional LysR family regulator